MQPSTDRNKARTTLRLSELEQQKLLRQMEEREAAYKGRTKRRSERLPFPKGVSVTIAIDQGMSAVPFSVRGRNISPHGMSFLHGQFVHPSSKCAVTLVTPAGEQLGLTSTVKRCIYVTGGAHEIGVEFDEVFNLEGFLEGLDTEDAQAVRTSAQHRQVKLQGRLLYVDDSAAARRLISHHLTRIGLCVDECVDAVHAVRLAKENTYDLLLIDTWLNGQSGMELLSQLRRQGIQTPALAITADERPQTGEEAQSVGFSGVLLKPTSRQDLEAALTPMMPEAAAAPTSASAALASTLWNDSSMRPFITRFVQELRHLIGRIDESLITDGLKPSGKVYHRCLQIAADAGAYGYPPIVSIAKTICQLIDHEAELGEIQQQVKDLHRKAEAALAGV